MAHVRQSTLAFIGVTDLALYWLAGVLAILSNVFHGASSVVHLPTQNPNSSE